MGRPKAPIFRYVTHYYASMADTADKAETQGRCKQPGNAVRQTVWRVFEAQYAKAQVVDAYTGAVLYTVVNGDGKRASIMVNYGSVGFMPASVHHIAARTQA